MNILITDKALKFLEKKRAEDITLTLAEIETGCCIGVAKEIKVLFLKPKKTSNFRWKQVGKYHFYVDRRLKEIGPIVLKKQGFWKFSTLYVEGLQVPI